jgi:hypothetical protein
MVEKKAKDIKSQRGVNSFPFTHLIKYIENNAMKVQGDMQVCFFLTI